MEDSVNDPYPGSIYEHYVGIFQDPKEVMSQMRKAWDRYRSVFRSEFAGRKDYDDVLNETREGHPYCDPFFFALQKWTGVYDYEVDDVIEDTTGNHHVGRVTGFAVVDDDQGFALGMKVDWVDGGVQQIYRDHSFILGFRPYEIRKEVLEIAKYLVSNREANSPVEPPRDPRDRAEVVRAMDCLMHHLNNEDAIAAWLSDGVPDGLDWRRTDEYMDFSDEDFEDYVRLFCRIIDNEAFSQKYRKGVFSCNLLRENRR